MITISESELKHQFRTYSACTLKPEDIGTHNSGWTITANVSTDYYE
jgi:hypothetical protein